ncbi:MAG: protein translocase subunit SecF [Aggregatilineales bacterium]
MKLLMKITLLLLFVTGLTIGVLAQDSDATEDVQATEEAIIESTTTEDTAPPASADTPDGTLISVIAAGASIVLLGVAFASRKAGTGLFDLVQNRRFFFLISSAVIIPGLLIMGYSTIVTGAPFRLSIDFEGGSIYDLTFNESGATEASIREVFATYGDENVIIQQLGTDEDFRWSVRGAFQDTTTIENILADLDALASLNRDRFDQQSVSATIGQEVTRAALFAVAAGALVITGFIVIAFREVPNALRYGVCAIIAMLHDVLVVMGVMSLMGILLGWEVDALFLTAVLTVVGFSVQDSIVVFDRIRENIPIRLGEPYETIVNRSIWETIHRSLATQLNAFFIMIAILLFGGETVQQFIFILFIGLLSGSYSSLFTAVPLLVAWEKGEIPFLKAYADDDEDAAYAPA